MRRSNSGALSDGRRLAKLIQDEQHRIPPGLELVRQEKFDHLCAKSFKPGSSLEQIKHDANAIREMWEILPDGAKTRDHDLHFRLIAATAKGSRSLMVGSQGVVRPDVLGIPFGKKILTVSSM